MSDYQHLSDERLDELESLAGTYSDNGDEVAYEAFWELFGEVVELRSKLLLADEVLRSFATALDTLTLVARQAEDPKLRTLLDAVLRQAGLLSSEETLFPDEPIVPVRHKPAPTKRTNAPKTKRPAEVTDAG